MDIQIPQDVYRQQMVESAKRLIFEEGVTPAEYERYFATAHAEEQIADAITDPHPQPDSDDPRTLAGLYD